MTNRNLIVPGEGIKLSEDEATRLGAQIHERVLDLERDHANFFIDIAAWWNQYEAKPKFAQKDFPFKNASNLIVPLIKAQSMALVNRLLGMVFGHGDRIWLPRTENTRFEPTARDVVRWLNWAANGNDFDFRGPITDWLNELIPIGSAVMALNWRRNMRTVAVSHRGGHMKTRQVNFGRGPIFEHIPREMILWDVQYPIADAPLVSRELRLHWSDINQIATNSPGTGWILENLEKTQHDEGLSGPSRAVEEAKRQLDRIEPKREPLEYREVWADWPAFRKLSREEDLTPNEEPPGHPSALVVLTYHYKSRRIVRARLSPYNLPYKPFFDGYYRKRPGRSHGIGVAKDLFPMQEAQTVLLNQAIDSRTRANSFWSKTNRRDLVSKVVDPRYPIYVPDGGMFEGIQGMDKSVLQDVSLFQIVNQIGERLTGQADPVMGRESRSGGHPSPATSTLALLGQSDEMIGSLRMSIRNQIGRMGEAAAILYQQFETNEDGKLQRTLGELDAENIEAFLFPTEAITGNIIFDVAGMSQTQNPQQEISRNIQLAQMNVNYWTFASQVMQMAIQAQQQFPQHAQMFTTMAMKSIQAQTRFQERLLEAGNVDDIEQFVLTFRNAFREDRSQLLDIAQQFGAMGGSPQPPQLPAMAGAGAPNGSGALVAPGGFGRGPAPGSVPRA